MNTPLDEVRRLRQALADKEHELAELRGLVQAHIEATSGDDHGPCLARERAAYERGEEWGYRRGIEHALVAVDDAHLAGTAHDQHGQMRPLGLQGPVPPKMTADQVVAAAEDYTRRHAEWWWHESQRQPPSANVREIHAGKNTEREKEAG